MFILQVYTEDRGWRFATSVWEDEVGWCYMDSPEHPARHARVEDAEQDARDLAAECEVRTAVFDETLGIRVFECAPPAKRAGR
ncbi:hypothetical protein CEG18_29155 [Pseudomonas nitroreducens]|uniref:Uncharacterized protein n=1 Tax=Pseudomonas nitroreducens TaxID=46680 RepID=A0A246F337_PSENT|nr:hypothetical protein CEG18_29155 [Pseudomonas nitroreducens]